ncbi:Calcium channel flower-like protein [Trichoplax sp. H2]|nr:Calcium channel flower-like protein [Trichoplax sp. H2]|eukprot:RDD44422.1 Calcium channel flower-like protein [Trichoplax sp. H2]
MKRVLGSLPNNEDEFNKTYKCGARCFGTLAAVVCIINGIITVITVSPLCIAMGAYMILLGVGIFIFEAPLLCKQAESARTFHEFISNRRFIEKAAIYILLSLVPILVCFGITTLIGCGMVFITGVFYGLMAIGKRGGARQKQPDQQELDPLNDVESQKGDAKK